MYKSGEDFLDKIYSDMHNSEIVNHTALKSDKPEEKIKKRNKIKALAFFICIFFLIII